MHKKALIFDFDLTLADSSQGIFQCVNYALQHMEYQPVEYLTVKNLIGHSLTDTFKLLTNNHDNEKAKEFVSLFTEHADKVMNINTSIFPEVLTIIPEIKRLGFLTAIVSTKFRYRIAGILERDGITEYFDCIVGGEDVKEHKPNPEGLLMAIEKLKVNKNDVIYIGDTVIDAETAKRSNVDFIGVLTGTTSEADFRTIHKDFIINNLNEIISVIDKNRN